MKSTTPGIADRVNALARSLLTAELVKYGLASVIALAVDMALFSTLMRLLGVSYTSAATVGFTAGAAVVYAISVSWVFSQRTFRQHPALELLTFVTIGLAGLAVTHAVLWLGVDRMHLVPEAVKLAAAGATFLFNFILRKLTLFRAAGEDATLAPTRT